MSDYTAQLQGLYQRQHSGLSQYLDFSFVSNSSELNISIKASFSVNSLFSEAQTGVTSASNADKMSVNTGVSLATFSCHLNTTKEKSHFCHFYMLNVAILTLHKMLGKYFHKGVDLFPSQTLYRYTCGEIMVCNQTSIYQVE